MATIWSEVVKIYLIFIFALELERGRRRKVNGRKIFNNKCVGTRKYLRGDKKLVFTFFMRAERERGREGWNILK